MYRFNLQHIAIQLMLADPELKKKEAMLHAFSVVEQVVEIFNLGCEPDIAYERINSLEANMKNNVAIESCLLQQINALKAYTVNAGWDERIRVRLISGEFKYLNCVNVGMDLDATIAEQNAKANDLTPLSELIDENPSAEDISKIQERIASEQARNAKPNTLEARLSLAVPVKKSHFVHF